MGSESRDIVVCPMTAADLGEVLAIESASFPRPWNRDHFLAELGSPHAFPLTAFAASGEVIGYICPMQLLDEGHILDVAVRHDFRGRGVGRLLVVKAVDECRRRGAEFVSLEVRPSNREAIALYERLGFREAGVRRRYYENGEDALLMELIFDDSKDAGDAI